jgi:ubiquinone/menaquinone biosynthesis C-methylase UbiE
VIGVDLYRSFEHLAALAAQNLGGDKIPGNLAFEQNTLGERLPIATQSVDLVYSWSVFEHLADVRGTLSEFARIVRAGGAIFIQIEPLFFGPFGSHMQRLVDEPWAHLAHDESEFVAMLQAAEDHVPESERDVLYRTHAFDELKRHLIDEYRSLNRITADELVRHIEDAGFTIEDERRIRVEGLFPDDRLLARYSPDLLLTNQVVVLATKR